MIYNRKRYFQNPIPSIEPTSDDFKCGVFEEDNYFLISECIYSVSDEKLVYVYVLLSNFTGYQNYGNGSAICLTNCGIYCYNTAFADCISISGCGGAVFINNSFQITNNATFHDVHFINISNNTTKFNLHLRKPYINHY